jgi:hypothetical protein
VSIKGRDYTWFRQALEHRDLATVRSTLVDLPPLTLEDALSVALLICEREPENAVRVLATDLGRALYRRRQGMIEPVFANTKFNRRIDRFQRRGRSLAGRNGD